MITARRGRSTLEEPETPAAILERALPAPTPGPTPAPVARVGGMHRSYAPVNPTLRSWRRTYFSPMLKFAAAASFAACWIGLSAWISLPWIHQLARHMTLVPAIAFVTLLAFVPGFLVAFVTAGAILDRQPVLSHAHPTTPLTVLIAAPRRGSRHRRDHHLARRKDYTGEMSVILIDNGSTDRTAERARAAAAATGLDLLVIDEPLAGKNTPSTRYRVARTVVIITLDADTLLQSSAIRLLTARLENSPPDVVAVAGNVMVRNSRNGVWSRMQAWDYMLGIAAVKRVQGLFQGTLVAQGAFSIYRTDDVLAVGGWPDAIGEDIVLTWRLMCRGRVYYEPLAVAFTGTPERLRGLLRQRSRWARGMLEGIRAVPPWRQPRGMARALTSIDLAIPLLDVAYLFVWLPGLVLACFGVFWFVGPMTVAVVPMTMLVYGLLHHYQLRNVLKPLGLTHRRNGCALVLFLFGYQALMSLASVRGYLQELFQRQRAWK